MRNSFKWHFQAQLLWWAYVIQRNCLHMFGYTISEMIPSSPDDVRGVHVDPLPPPPSPRAGCALLHYPIRKERCQRADWSAPFPAQSHRLSSVPFVSVPIFSSPHLHKSKALSGKIYLTSQKDSGNA